MAISSAFRTGASSRPTHFTPIPSPVGSPYAETAAYRTPAPSPASTPSTLTVFSRTSSAASYAFSGGGAAAAASHRPALISLATTIAETPYSESPLAALEAELFPRNAHASAAKSTRQRPDPSYEEPLGMELMTEEKDVLRAHEQAKPRTKSPLSYTENIKSWGMAEIKDRDTLPQVLGFARPEDPTSLSPTLITSCRSPKLRQS